MVPIDPRLRTFHGWNRIAASLECVLRVALALQNRRLLDRGKLDVIVGAKITINIAIDHYVMKTIPGEVEEAQAIDVLLVLRRGVDTVGHTA